MNFKKKQQRKTLNIIYIIAFLLCIILVYFAVNSTSTKQTEHTQATFAMSTVVTQSVYGKNAQAAASAVEAELANFETLISLYDKNSDIAKINDNAGKNAVPVDDITISLALRAKELSLESGGAFAATIAPLTLLWGVNTSTPSVPHHNEISKLLPLVDDSKITIDESGGTIKLEATGQALDYGGIAKGYACNLAKIIYEQNDIESALISIGGNVYVHGTKPGGDMYRIGFRNPHANTGQQVIASCELEDAVFSVSGGYERYFEEDGKQYHHIIDPATGYPSTSDVLSVGVVHKDGTEADFYSTTLFVQGLDATLTYFENGGTGMAVDFENNIYVSSDLKQSFELADASYNVIYISGI